MSALPHMLDRVVRELGTGGLVLRVEHYEDRFIVEAWNPNTGDTIRQQTDTDVADALGALSRDLRLHPLTGGIVTYTRGNVVEWRDGKRQALYGAALERAAREQPLLICTTPHEDERFDYQCSNQYCRCNQ